MKIIGQPVFLFIFLRFFIFENTASAQNFQWTWVKGNASYNNVGIYGAKGVSAAANKPGGRWGGLNWTDQTGNLWLFGGFGYGKSGFGMLNDLWKYNIAANEWTWVSGSDDGSYIAPAMGVYGTMGSPDPANVPGARLEGFSWIDAADNLWLFGGYGAAASSPQGYLNDLWKFNTTTNEWTWISGSNNLRPAAVYGTKGVPSAANVPCGKYRGASWTDVAGNLWLFGGQSYSSTGTDGYGNDLWKYNPQTNEWTWMKGDSTINSANTFGTQGVGSPANSPGAREETMSVTDQQGNFWLFGGLGYSPNLTLLNDLWKFNVSANEWTWIKGDTTSYYGDYGTLGVAALSNIPGPRHSGSIWADLSGNLWMLGGRGEGTNFGELNDLWKYNIATNTWTWAGGSSSAYDAGIYGTQGTPAATNRPGAREKAMHWTDNQGRIWLFGGGRYPPQNTTTSYHSDLWGYPLPVTCNLPAPSATATQPTCTVANGSITVTSPVGTGLSCSIDGLDYSNTSGVFLGLAPNTYNVTVRNSSGCTSPVLAVVISPAPPVPASPAVATVQPTCTAVTGAITITAPVGAGLSYSIDGTDYSNTSGLFLGLVPNTYNVTVKSNSGCFSPATSIVIAAAALPPTPIVSVIQPTCILPTGQLTISSPAGAGIVYSIDGTTYSNTTGIFSGLAPNTYTATAADSDGCVSPLAIAVIQTVPALHIVLTATPSTVSPGEMVHFATTGNTPFTVTGWQPAALFANQSSTVQNVIVNTAGNFIVSGINGDGCIDTARVLVTVQASDDIYIPNTFTPNGDGKNDLFYVYGHSITQLELKIFNQWGQFIFLSNNQNTGWNGLSNGRMQPATVYVYTLKATINGGREVFKNGSVTLIR